MVYCPPSKMMKKYLLLVLAVLLALALCACAPKQTAGDAVKTGEQPDTPGANRGTWAPFELGGWLENPDNAAKFEHIAVNVFSDTWTRGEKPIAEIALEKADKEAVLGFFDGVLFWAADPPSGDQAFDFAFAMNEPFMFFTFTDDTLYIKAPSASDPSGYDCFSQKMDEYDSLWSLKEYIGEARLGYYESHK